MYPHLLSTLIPAVVALFLASRIYNAWVARSKLQHIPAVGPPGIFESYGGAFKLITDGRRIIQESYDKYYGSAFKVPLIAKWKIIITGPDMMDDVRKATDDQLSFHNAIADILQVDYTMDHDIHVNPYHVPFVRLSLSRNLGAFFPEMHDEMTTAFGELAPAKDEWVKVPMWDAAREIVFRTSNRLFVGLPLCRNAGYRAQCEEYATALFKTAFIIGLVPNFFKPVVGRLLYSYVPASINRVHDHIAPVVEQRRAKEKQYGPNWPGKPNDLITWLMEKAPADGRSSRALTIRVLAVNFAALHSTSMGLAHALFDLAAYPSYVSALREEVEAVVEKEGLSKEAIEKMYKLDSFVKESLRLRATPEVGVSRKVMKDFTFSNGTFLPAGSTIGAAGYSMHHDKKSFPDPEEFDGFRFYRMREAENERVKYQTVSLSLDYVTFGNGRHACPGRFFATTALKLALAHVLLTYDVKLEQEGVRPADRWFAFTAMPNPTAELMFKKRAS